MSSDPRAQIEASLQALATDRPFRGSANDLFIALGYASDRELDYSVEEYLETQGVVDEVFRARALMAEWKQSALLQQITDDEIRTIASGPGLFDGDAGFQPERAGSFLFAAIDLAESAYTRTQLATITRAINAHFPMPVILLFRHGETVTIAIERTRINKRDKSRDVSEKVTLIKDIRCDGPIRAHLDILGDLALDALHVETPFTNFEELRSAWEKQLDASKVTNRFYRDVANWYFWALKHPQVVFPRSVKEESDRSLFLIRLLTRLIFCWFLQEKGLVPPDLFRARIAKGIIKSSQAESSDYYRAVLQNLFFATLNQEIDSRGFRNDERFQGKADDRGITNLYRYADLLADKERLLGYFAQIPFVNGGLFDCLDRPDEKYRADDFSEEKSNSLSLPWELFFGAEQRVDLSDEYGEARRRNEPVRGLFEIFGRYKFTVEENTPIEEEIALDPELLGHVFENLSAAFNEETGTTARKATGSFYTPRAVVSFMVDEALILYLSNELKQQKSADASTLEVRLRTFFGTHEERVDLFNPFEVRQIVRAIDRVKILDPACGSGAFPMGALQRLVDLLTRLDPGSKEWQAVQRERAIAETEEAYRRQDHAERQARIAEIEQVFTNNTEDYGRKLYLIENCLYGVDIQPIATQIAKLRFFISLIVDQRVDRTAPNFNVRPLPNLETRIVAADSLNFVKTNADVKGEQGEVQYAFFRNEIDDLRAELQEVRHKYFTARRTQEKRKYRQKDAALRAKIAELLEKELVDADDAYRLAYWDPYDQNAHADFFDPAWMFGIAVGNGQPQTPPTTVTGKFGFVNEAEGQQELVAELETNASGFDIVIGNPPYVRQEKIRERKPTLQKNYSTYVSTADLYVYFYERAVRLLKARGILSFITSNKWYRAAYGEKLRKWMNENIRFHRIIDFGDFEVFEAVAYPTIVVGERDTLHRGSESLSVLVWSSDYLLADLADAVAKLTSQIPRSVLSRQSWHIGSAAPQDLLDRLKANMSTLARYTSRRLYRGIITGLNDAFVITNATRTALLNEDPRSQEIIKPFLRGRDVRRWDISTTDLYLVAVKCGSDPGVQHPWSGARSEAEAYEAFAETYPAVCRHLSSYEDKLRPRSDQGQWWWELRACAFYDAFEQPKIVYPNICVRPEFAFDTGNFYTNQKCYILPTSDKFLLGLLNSSITRFYFEMVIPRLRGGFFEPGYAYMEGYPVPDVQNNLKVSIGNVADRCLFAWKNAPESLPALETELNTLVYQAYGLTDEEIALIEGTPEDETRSETATQ